MRSHLFHESPKTVHTSAKRWIRILPDDGHTYALIDLVDGSLLGKVLVDDNDHWIYDGSILDLEEQGEVAGQIVGHQHEMDELLKTLNFGA